MIINRRNAMTDRKNEELQEKDLEQVQGGAKTDVAANWDLFASGPKDKAKSEGFIADSFSFGIE